MSFFKGALKTKANKILISTSFLFKYHPSPQDFYRFSSQWYINQFERHNISRDYDIEIIGIGGGFLKYILTLVYGTIEIKKYFKKLCLPVVRIFLNDELNKKIAFPIGYYITITKKNG